MLIAYHAAKTPDASAIVTNYGERTFAELNANANRFVRLLEQHDIGPGDSVAVVTKNRPEFLDVLAATTRHGIRFTPSISISKAKRLAISSTTARPRRLLPMPPWAIPSRRLNYAPGARLKLAVGGDIPGFTDFHGAIEGLDDSNIANRNWVRACSIPPAPPAGPKACFR